MPSFHLSPPPMTLLLPLLLAVHSLPHPDTPGCCRRHGLSDTCIHLLCHTDRPPTGMKAFRAATNCSRDLNVAAQCLADGRNHSLCCQQRAEDADQNACFDLCQGVGAKSLNRSDWEQWDAYRSYMTCMSFNADSIYRCYREGYENSPTPPRDIQATVESPTTVKLSWKKPRKFPEIAKRFVVYYGVDLEEPAKPGPQRMEQFMTNDTEKMVEGLRPDTRYGAYVVSYAKDGEHLSLKSETTHFVTGGIPPEIQPYKNLVQGAFGYPQTLVCRVSVFGLKHRHLTVIWQHKRRGESSFRTLEHRGDDKYNLVAYQAAENRDPTLRNYISSLTIKHLAAEDFGVYSCLARNKFGSAAAEVILERSQSTPIPAGPPNIAECCRRVGMSAACMHGCQGPTDGKPANATSFWGKPSCVLEIPKLLSCSMDGVDQGSCCLRRRVPFGCLPFCDGGFSLKDISILQMFRCLSYTTQILACQQEAKISLPEVVRSLRVVSPPSLPSPSLLLQWEAADRASLYHLYYRLVGNKRWSRKSVPGTETSINPLSSSGESHEIVVVASNAVGHSGASKTLFWPSLSLRDGASVHRRPTLDSDSSRTPRDRLRVGTGRLQDFVAHSNSDTIFHSP